MRSGKGEEDVAVEEGLFFSESNKFKGIFILIIKLNYILHAFLYEIAYAFAL